MGLSRQKIDRSPALGTRVSDRGSRCASHDYTDLLKDRGIQIVCSHIWLLMGRRRLPVGPEARV